MSNVMVKCWPTDRVGIALMGVVVDLISCQILVAKGLPVERSQIAGFLLGALVNLGLNSREILTKFKRPGWTIPWPFCGRLLLLALLAVLLRSSVLRLLTLEWDWQTRTAILAAALFGDAIFLAAIYLFVIVYSQRSDSTVTPWPLVSACLVTYILLLKLVFMGCLNLIPEEAYYWNYAQHIDIGYLDHPPMVGWLIWISTSLFEKSEFSLRLPAYLCWIIAALFMARLTLNLCDRSSAYRTTLLLAVLPIYFGLGFFMTPDAPLLAAWAATLYYLERVFFAQDRRAWLGVGVCLGLGLLSKYTVALLGAAILVFLVVDRQSRHWLVRREPYLAALVAVIFFSPVLIWNVRNDWISFAFQGTGRWTGRPHFSLHVLLGSILLLLSPMGFLGIMRVLFFSGRADEVARYGHQTETRKRQCRWVVTFTLVPLSVFVLHSFLDTPKLNWTAPVWLAAIPLLASDMATPPVNGKSLWAKLRRKAWMPTIIGLIFLHSGFFYYVSRGLPGAGLMSPGRLFGEWRELGVKVGNISRIVEAKNGSRPILVGMDRNFISSELSFYYPTDDNGVNHTAGLHLFGQRSLMWALWFPRSAAVGKDLLLISFEPERLMSSSLEPYFETLSAVVTERLEKEGRTVGYFYWRVGRDFRD